MARKTFIALAGACILSFGFAQSGGKPVAKNTTKVYPLRAVDHGAFKVGEKLTYILHYGLLNAGEATLELQAGDREIQGRKILHAVGRGKIWRSNPSPCRSMMPGKSR